MSKYNADYPQDVNVCNWPDSPLTKREMFAAMALQGMLASGKLGGDFYGAYQEKIDLVVLNAYRYADAMVAKSDE